MGERDRPHEFTPGRDGAICAVCGYDFSRHARYRPIPRAMPTAGRDRLGALLADLFPVAERSRWPFTVEQAADRLIAAGVTFREEPQTPSRLHGADDKRDRPEGSDNE